MCAVRIGEGEGCAAPTQGRPATGIWLGEGGNVGVTRAVAPVAPEHRESPLRRKLAAVRRGRVAEVGTDARPSLGCPGIGKAPGGLGTAPNPSTVGRRRA